MYLTFIQKQRNNLTNKDYSLDDLFSGKSYQDIENKEPNTYPKTKTIITAQKPTTFNQQELNEIVRSLKELVKPYKDVDLNKEYHTFHIPKHSGGLREINAPNERLMETLKQMQNIFQYRLKVVYHNAAFAYVPKRNIVDALKVHQDNNSRWYLKLDIKHFFPSCNQAFVTKFLHMLYPFSEININDLEDILDICFKNDELPQGTPMSPMLTNLIMIPLDFAIQAYAFENHLIYTRYADDILISGYNKWNWGLTVDAINIIFTNFMTPFILNEDKTRFGSSAGRNWNLGLMVNKDNKITVGYRKKKQYKAMINNLFTAEAKDEPWNKEELYHFQGITSYYLSVEPKYFKKIIEKYENMYNLALKDLYKLRL